MTAIDVEPLLDVNEPSSLAATGFDVSLLIGLYIIQPEQRWRRGLMVGATVTQ
jgi:hypothetical protein